MKKVKKAHKQENKGKHRKGSKMGYAPRHVATTKKTSGHPETEHWYKHHKQGE